MTALVRLVVAAFVLVLAPVVFLLAVIDRNSAWGFAFLGFLLVGAMILWRQIHNTIGWLLFVVGASTGVLVVDQWYVRGSSGPGSVAAELAFVPLSSLPWTALILLVLLFPDGRATTRLQSVLVPVVVLVGTVGVLASMTQPNALTSKRPNPLAADWAAHAASWLIDGPGSLVIPAVLFVALVSLVRRWRHSEGDRRLQFRWLIWAGGITLVAVPVLFGYSGGPWSVLGVILLLSFWAIPVAIGIAVTRFRLYDIDRVISRTASYVVVTALLVLTYVVIVTSASRLVGSQSPLIVATATLAAAALFRPVLKRVQVVVDRRFNRAKFDGEREVEHFGTMLTDEVHPDRARAELIAVTQRTLAPKTVSLWTADPSRDPAAQPTTT